MAIFEYNVEIIYLRSIDRGLLPLFMLLFRDDSVMFLFSKVNQCLMREKDDIKSQNRIYDFNKAKQETH